MTHPNIVKGMYDIIMAKREIDANGCWLFTGPRWPAGYGHVTFRSVQKGAHQVMMLSLGYELGPGVEVAHKCDNPPCFNPDHLFITNHQGNQQDMTEKGRNNGAFKMNESPTCSNGHPRTEENTNWFKRGSGMIRQCKLCQQLASARHHERKGAKPQRHKKELANAREVLAAYEKWKEENGGKTSP